MLTFYFMKKNEIYLLFLFINLAWLSSMDDLLNQFNSLNTHSDYLNVFNGKITATRFIPANSVIGKIYGTVKCFWEIYPEYSKSFTIDKDMVLDITHSNTCFRDLKESTEDGNVILTYNMDYDTGTIDNFTILTIKDIQIGEEVIIKFSNF